jgi:hypothetical protein
MSSYFTPLRRSPSQHISLIIDDAAARGLAFARSTTDGTKGVVANSATAGALGFLFREVTEDGPDIVQRTQAWGTSPEVHELEQPDKAGGQCTLEVLEKYRAEGEDIVLLSGTGKIESNTALQTSIGFYNGKSRILQGGELDQGYRLAQILTDGLDDPDNNDFAIIVEKVI